MSPGALAQRGQFDCGARKRAQQFGAEMAGGDQILQRQIAGGDDPHIDLVGIARADGPHLVQLHRLRAADPASRWTAGRPRRAPACRRRNAATTPTCCSKAPGKAPFSCPNSKDSRLLAGTPPILTMRNAALARGLAACIARTSISLPVPLSPSISTWPWPRAALAALASASRNGGAVPTIASKSRMPLIFSVSGVSSSLRRFAGGGVAQRLHQPVGRDRLDEVIGRPGAHRLHRQQRRGAGGEHQDRQRGAAFLQFRDQFAGLIARNPLIENDRGQAACPAACRAWRWPFRHPPPRSCAIPRGWRAQ